MLFFLIRKQFVLKLESVLPLAVLDNRVLILKIEKALSIVKKKPLNSQFLLDFRVMVKINTKMGL